MMVSDNQLLALCLHLRQLSFASGASDVMIQFDIQA
jgi:hypothetical protein